MPQEDHRAAKLQETKEVCCMHLIANYELPEVEEPREEALDFPAPAVAAEASAVLGLRPVRAVWSDERDPALFEARVEAIRVVGFVADDEPRPLMAAKEVLTKKAFQEARLVGGSRFKIDGERKTVAVDHCHDLAALPALGFADVAAPFFAGAKVPSTNASSGSSLPRSFKSRASVSTIRRIVPSRTQAEKRRWHVAYGGYRPGMSFHGAPVRSTQRIPFSTSRFGLHGRPRLSSRTGSSGKIGSSFAHCSSVRSIHQLLPDFFRHGNPVVQPRETRSLFDLAGLWNRL